MTVGFCGLWRGHWASEEAGEACWKIKTGSQLLAVVVGAWVACLAAYLIFFLLDRAVGGLYIDGRLERFGKL